MIDVYESAVEEAGRFGAVFERDDETAYFYLLDMRAGEGGQIVSTFNADIVTDMPASVPVSVKWNSTGTAVGLFVDDNLMVIFDLRSDNQKARWANGEDYNLFQTH